MERIQATMKPKKATKYKKRTYPDIIVEQVQYVEKIEKDGSRIIKPIKKKINITKKVNATAKLIKRETTADIEAKLDEVFEQKKAEMVAEIKEKGGNK